MKRSKIFFLLTSILLLTSCSNSASSYTYKDINLTVNNNDSYGLIEFDSDSYVVGETLTFTIKEITSDYDLSYIEINNQKYITNNDNYFSFEITDVDVNITTYYIKSELSNDFVDVNFTSNENISFTCNDYVYSNKVYLNDFVSFNLSLNNNSSLGRLYLNDEYIISLNKSDTYNFKAMFSINNITAITLSNGESNSEVYINFINYVNNRDLSEIDFSSDETLANFKVIDLAYIAFYMIDNTDLYIYSYNQAISNALFISNEQNTCSLFIQNNSNIFKEDIAVGDNLKMAQRFIYDGNNINHYLVSGDSVNSNMSASYDSNDYDTYTYDSYLEYFGINIDTIFKYDLSSYYQIDETQTIEDMEFDSSIVKTAEGYQINLNLDPQSAYDYSKYMITTTNFDGAPSISYQNDYPSFEAIGISILLDEYLRPLELISRETYTVHALIDVETHSASKSIFYYESLEFPALENKINYDHIYGQTNF